MSMKDNRNLYLIICCVFFFSSVSARNDVYQVRLSQYHPQATKQHLLDRVLPEQYHERFIANQKWDVTQLDRHPINLNEETYYVALPENYDPEKRYGLLVWIDPSDNGLPKREWLRVFNELGFIYVAANNSGNQHSVTARRIPLALHALHNMQQQYPIDQSRVYVAGFSGGGFTASSLAIAYGDFVEGAFYMSGANELGGQRVGLPPAERLEKVKTHNRYVFYAGTKEKRFLKAVNEAFNSYEAQGVQNIHLLNTARRGHYYVDSKWLKKGLLLLDHGIK